MINVCKLPYGLELVADPDDCSPFFRRGRHFMCRPHERTDPAECREIAKALMVEEVRHRRANRSEHNIQVAAIVAARMIVDQQLRDRLRKAA